MRSFFVGTSYFFVYVRLSTFPHKYSFFLKSHLSYQTLKSINGSYHWSVTFRTLPEGGLVQISAVGFKHDATSVYSYNPEVREHSMSYSRVAFVYHHRQDFIDWMRGIFPSVAAGVNDFYRQD